jgi:hypothetical protein
MESFSEKAGIWDMFSAKKLEFGKCFGEKARFWEMF